MQGETLGDLRHGIGKHVCSNGDTHQGGWYKGMRHGQGLATFARGFVYEGSFSYDHASGCVLLHLDLFCYSNCAATPTLCSKLPAFTPAALLRKTDIIHSLQSCHLYRSGKAKYENGGIFDGEFENDKRHGWGTHCFPDESIYIGEWADDKISGEFSCVSFGACKIRAAGDVFSCLRFLG